MKDHIDHLAQYKAEVRQTLGIVAFMSGVGFVLAILKHLFD